MRNHWIYLLGDSVFDCGRYNALRETPGRLIYRNRDDLFPEFQGQDIKSQFPGYNVRDLSLDGATIEEIDQQYQGADLQSGDIVLISVGGNDFLQGLYQDRDGEEVEAFINQYGFILSQISSKKVIANIYDPFFGKMGDIPRFQNSGVPPDRIRYNYDRINQGIGKLASRYGALMDLQGHFLTGDSSWFTQTIEPSLQGASEIRRVIWGALSSIL